MLKSALYLSLPFTLTFTNLLDALLYVHTLHATARAGDHCLAAGLLRGYLVDDFQALSHATEYRVLRRQPVVLVHYEEWLVPVEGSPPRFAIATMPGHSRLDTVPSWD